jgi:subtilisin family serine protease
MSHHSRPRKPDDTKVTRARFGTSLALSLVGLCLVAPTASDAVDFNVWGAEDVNAPAAWSISRGDGVQVAVVDTGVMGSHEELRGRVSGPDNDVEGHGTAVAGVIVADPDNGKGIEGVAPDASIIPVPAFTDEGTQSAAAIVQALDLAGASGARVVNASFGTDPYDRRNANEFNAVEHVLAKHPDTLYVAAAGNEDNDNDEHPVLPCNAESPNLICVGAYSLDRRPWDHTNYGENSVDIMAPGVSIRSSTLPFSVSYNYFSGTSMSAAYVSGVAALLFSKVPRLTPEGAIGLLLSTTRQLTAGGGQARSASGGSPDAVAALQAAVIDSDRDGVYDVVDDCPSQAYPSADGCTPAPQPTPTATPAPTAMPTPAPTPGPRPRGEPVPQLRSLQTTVTRCKPHKSCKRSATVKFRPDRTAKVSLRVDRRVCTNGRRCRWKRYVSTSRTAGTRGARVVVRGAHKRSLPIGLYRVVAVPSSTAGKGSSKTRQFRVR